MLWRLTMIAVAGLWLVPPVGLRAEEGLHEQGLREELAGVPHRILFESNRSGNWDIWIVNADGSGLANLTNTRDVDEIHAHASPDGTKVAFIGDRISRVGRMTRIERAVYVMNIDGTEVTKIADGVQNPCWNPDGTALAMVRSSTLNPVTEYYTRDLLIYDLKAQQMKSVRRGLFTGIFALTWSPDGQWFMFAQRGMKRFGYQLLLTDTEGQHIYSIKNYGCRPDFSPDGSRVAWNTSDEEIAVGRLDLTALTPDRRDPLTITDLRLVAKVDRGKAYYVDWSPDGRYLAYARGHAANPGHSFKEPGDWRIWVTRSDDLDPVRLPVAVPITNPPKGADDKEPDWVPAVKKP